MITTNILQPLVVLSLFFFFLTINTFSFTLLFLPFTFP